MWQAQHLVLKSAFCVAGAAITLHGVALICEGKMTRKMMVECVPARVQPHAAPAWPETRPRKNGKN